MTSFKKLSKAFALLFLVFFSACSFPEPKEANTDKLGLSRGLSKDQNISEILRIALEKALSDERLPMSSALVSNDSILLCIDLPKGIFFDDLPTVGDYKFKILPREALCQMLISEKMEDIPAYLYVHSIVLAGEKASLKVENSRIALNNSGHKSQVCDYFSHCGGGMEIIYHKDHEYWTGDIGKQWKR